MKIAFLNNKGGTGKTTFAVNLAWAMSKRCKVYVIDTDYAQSSALNWLMGRDKEYIRDKWYKVNETLWAICPTRENIMKTIRSLENKENVIIDGRPEPQVTAEILEAGVDVVIAVVDLGDDARKQTEDLLGYIKREYGEISKYVIINKATFSRISYRIRQDIEKMGFDVLAILSFSEYVKWAEKNCVPIWQVRGANRIRFPDFIDFLAEWIVRRGL